MTLLATARTVVVASTTCERHAVGERSSTAAAAWAIGVSHVDSLFAIVMRRVRWLLLAFAGIFVGGGGDVQVKKGHGAKCLDSFKVGPLNDRGSCARAVHSACRVASTADLER